MTIDWHEARNLWLDGFDTKDIAEVFELPEADVYRNMDRLYGEQPERAAA